MKTKAYLILVLILVLVLGYCSCKKIERFSGDINNVIDNIKWSFDYKKTTKELTELDDKITRVEYMLLRKKYIDNNLKITPENVREILN